MHWWEWISSAASVVALFSAAVAAWTWVIGRYRVMDAYPDVILVSDWKARIPNGKVLESGITARIQNIGGAGMALQSINLKGCGASFKPILSSETAPTNVLMPGECQFVYLEDARPDATIVLEYISHTDAGRVHFVRFKLAELVPETYLLKTYVRPSFRQRRDMKYKDGELFNRDGISNHMRTIRMHGAGKSYDSFINAEHWLHDNGYKAIRIGTTGLLEKGDDLLAAWMNLQGRA